MNRSRFTRHALALAACAVFAAQAQAQDSGQRTVDFAIDAASGRLMPVNDSTIDLPAQVRFWADPARQTIVRKDANALAPQDIAAGLNLPYGLGFDRDTQTLIWTSSGDEVMQVMALNGGEVRALTSSFDDPPAIEIAHEGGKQAIALLDGAVVRVTVDAQTDARTDEVLFTLPAGESAIGLALDAQNNQVYLGNAVGMAAYKIDLNQGVATRLAYTDHVTPVPDADVGEPQ
jgi:hypothetical protein